jgi:hypothetical protein
MSMESTHHFIRATARRAARKAERQQPSIDARVIKLRHGRYRYVVRYQPRYKRRNVDE